MLSAPEMIRLSDVTGQFIGPTFSAMTPERDGRVGEGDFWDVLGDHALDPIRVPIIEALRQIGEPLSAIRMVDVLDGYLSMWEAADHLEVLRDLGVVEPTSNDQSSKRNGFDVPYRLKTVASGND